MSYIFLCFWKLNHFVSLCPSWAMAQQLPSGGCGTHVSVALLPAQGAWRTAGTGFCTHLFGLFCSWCCKTLWLFKNSFMFLFSIGNPIHFFNPIKLWSGQKFFPLKLLWELLFPASSNLPGALAAIKTGVGIWGGVAVIQEVSDCQLQRCALYLPPPCCCCPEGLESLRNDNWQQNHPELVTQHWLSSLSYAGEAAFPV